MPAHRIYPKLNKCPKCGNEYLQRDRRHRYCSLACSLWVATEAADQLHHHSGPTYDKWRAAMRKAAERL